MATNKRARHWSFVGYPADSLPEDYASILSDEMHLCWAESPLHDADLNGDGSEKKPHIHFVVSFEGMKSYEQVKEITDRLNCPIPQVCRNVASMVRYFIHIDNPDKHQYRQDEIKCHGGFDIEDYFKRSQTQNREVLKQILQFCEDNDITEFCVLDRIVRATGQDDWFDVMSCRNTLYIATILKSRHFMKKEAEANADY